MTDKSQGVGDGLVALAERDALSVLTARELAAMATPAQKAAIVRWCSLQIEASHADTDAEHRALLNEMNVVREKSDEVDRLLNRRSAFDIWDDAMRESRARATDERSRESAQ